MKHISKIGVLLALLSLTAIETACSQDLIPIRIVSMNYPPLAVAARITGMLKIKCNISPDGRVLSAEFLELGKKPTPDLLGEPVHDNVLQWRFPSSVNPGERSVVLTFTFDIVTKHDPSKVSMFVFDSPGSVAVTAEVSDYIYVD
jgi:hypothetical protein